MAKFRAALFALFGCAFAWQMPAQMDAVKRVYVEPFTVKDGSGKLREDVIAQLRKVKSLTIVPDRITADAVLSGDGEIWIKGYRSLNPRSGRLPSNGTPVYSGFLSVELRDVKGDTLWSYLVTARADSENVSKDLSKQIGKHLAEALAAGHGSPTSDYLGTRNTHK